MKLCTPEISWHNRDPIYSVDFQYKNGHMTRIVTSGTDKNIRIWSISEAEEGKVNIDFLSNLDRHSRAVNVVRFSPDGELLASAGDDSVVMLWRLQPGSQHSGATLFNDDENEANKETWTVQKVLRGHIEDIYDLCWSPDSGRMITGSVDNSAIVWDVKKGKPLAFLKESGSFIQGVAWDPKNQYLATLSCDRRLRIYNAATHQCMHSVQKMALPCQPTEKNGEPQKPKQFKMFHDDTMKSFFRRLAFSPDGEILVTPAGLVELEKEKNDDVIMGDDATPVAKETKEAKSEVNATFLFSRSKLNKPAVYLPYPPKATVAARCCPVLFQLREVPRKEVPANADPQNLKPWEKYETLFCRKLSCQECVEAPTVSNELFFSLPYRVVFAVATEESVLIYDSQQSLPLASISKIHYHQLSDLTWSHDGRMLVVASTDGYCSVVMFDQNELGQPYMPPETEKASEELAEKSVNTLVEPLLKSPEPQPAVPPQKSGEETSDLRLVLDDSNDEMDGAPISVTRRSAPSGDGMLAKENIEAPSTDKNENLKSSVDKTKKDSKEQSIESQKTEILSPSVNSLENGAEAGLTENSETPEADSNKPRRIAFTTIGAKKL